MIFFSKKGHPFDENNNKGLHLIFAHLVFYASLSELTSRKMEKAVKFLLSSCFLLHFLPPCHWGDCFLSLTLLAQGGLLN